MFSLVCVCVCVILLTEHTPRQVDTGPTPSEGTGRKETWLPSRRTRQKGLMEGPVRKEALPPPQLSLGLV